MKVRKIASVSSNEEYVRMSIYDGDIPLGDAGGRLLELALAEHRRSEAVGRLTAMCFDKIETLHQSDVLHPRL